MDPDLRSIQQARDLLQQAHAAQKQFAKATQEEVDGIVEAMVRAGAGASRRLGREAHEETGFGRPESKEEKNRFSTMVLHERMQGMKTVGIIRKLEEGAIWEVAVPMGVVAALIPSTNPTSTAMYKAIIAAKAGCGIVMSPHPRAIKCTAEALRVVAEAAYEAGAPEGLFACMTEVTLPGTNELLEHDLADIILATGGTAMVRAAYSKGKPAYGVGSGNVPVYVDRSADVKKAAQDLVYGASFDWGTLCSTERSVVADYPIKHKLVKALEREGAYFMDEQEKDQLRAILLRKGRLNVDQVGQSPRRIASMAGFRVPGDTRVLIGEVDTVGRDEPLSMETLSPILSFYTADGWQAGCKRCIEVLNFGGIGHTLGIHCSKGHIIEAFALEKPSMRIVVNTVAALGSVGYTNRLFPSMTLGPGTMGGSITSDNISPMHLLNVKRLAFETDPIHPTSERVVTAENGRARADRTGSWMEEVDERLRARAGNAPSQPVHKRPTPAPSPPPKKLPPSTKSSGLALPESEIASLIQRFKK